MTELGPCHECGVGAGVPCLSGCSCAHCTLVSLPIPTTVEAALHAANVAAFEGKHYEAQAQMIRLRHIAAGL